MVIARITDGDEASLAERVDRLAASFPGDVTVSHFTYWYTGRPPAFEAIIEAVSAADRRVG
jgi:hypothetical protein